MSNGLVELLGLGANELVAVVGAGGKSTLVATLGAEYAAMGRKVILTTTTKMSVDQLTEPACFTTDLGAVEAELVAGVPLFVVSGIDGPKVLGIEPGTVDELFVATTTDVVLVEADGARRRRFKAPADHEPAIPTRSTVVVVVAGASAIGGSIADVAHRPEIVAELAGVDVGELLTPAVAADVLVHPFGGRKEIPAEASLRYVITASAESTGAGQELAAEIRDRSPQAWAAVWTLDSGDEP